MHVLTMHLIQERLPVGNSRTDPSKHKRARTSMIEHKQRPNEHDQATGTHINKRTTNASTNSEHVFEDEDEPHESQGRTMSGRLRVNSLEHAKRPLTVLPTPPRLLPVAHQHPGRPCEVEPERPVVMRAGCRVGGRGEEEGEERAANSRSSSSTGAFSSSSSLNTDTSTLLVHLPPPALKLNMESHGVSREYTARLMNGGSGSSSS